jgi:hypothetical protein
VPDLFTNRTGGRSGRCPPLARDGLRCMNNVGRPFRLTPVITDMKKCIVWPLQALVWWNFISQRASYAVTEEGESERSDVQLDVLMSSLLSLNQRVSMEATSDSRFAGEARPQHRESAALCVCVEASPDNRVAGDAPPSTANQPHALRLCVASSDSRVAGDAPPQHRESAARSASGIVE